MDNEFNSDPLYNRDIILGYLPGLFTTVSEYNNSFKFCDQRISTDIFQIKRVRTGTMQGSWLPGNVRVPGFQVRIMNISNYSPWNDRDIEMELMFRESDFTLVSGYLAMGRDYELCDESCVALFDMGIDSIQYATGYLEADVVYDALVIRRRHTLNNIIND